MVALALMNLPANAEVRDPGSIPGSGRSPGGGHGNLLPCSCLEIPMGRGSWLAVVRRVSKSQTWLKQLNTCFCKQEIIKRLKTQEKLSTFLALHLQRSHSQRER